ncbi:MAG: GGDEF domain-containing protein [Gallionella sp.]|jgi:diguanylate cyclase (GGDEF)-like protein|nr:GGDEF domain-containing protein [Gallionella sp.]MCK9354652.1 GGDEF domain-containing protein [Gallionella sp.]
MSNEAPNKGIPSPGELLGLLDILTRHRDAQLVRLSAMQALFNLIRPDSIKLYDVLKRGEQYRIVLSAWNEGEQLHFNDEALSEERFEPIGPDSLLGRALGVGGGCHCDIQDGVHGCYLPVMMNDEPLSLFEIQSVRPFSLETMAVATGVVAVFRNYLELLEDSQRDTLTGLLNRKTFDEGFAVFLSAASRSDEREHARPDDRRSRRDGSHWVAVIDIDRFKRVNDTFGHLYGDEVLILMANLMRASFRQYDRLYRFGGEEFIVLMRDISFTDAKHRLEGFREKVEQHVFPQVGQVTVSIGFTAVASTSTPSMVLGNADEALYYAKGHGRNRVCCYGELVEQKLLAPKTVHTEADFF